MATTGFWPVKGHLKDVIDYAENPDKTIEKSYVDNDLYAALQYAENPAKTDQKMYVTAINCPTKRAYEYMMATKARYGKLGGNIAYHGFQSFRTGEVTPEEAHEIGLKTARRMWGDAFEIVVTTHLNTDNIHNHVIINSVSFCTGKKFLNKKADHYRFREISDEICREYSKSVLPPSAFSGSRKAEYWAHKKGELTHRDILKQDMESILPYCSNWDDLMRRLKSLGYRFPRDMDYSHISIIAPEWKRSVRLDTLGYTEEIIRMRIDENRRDDFFYMRRNDHPPFKHKSYPLLSLEKQLEFEILHSKDTATVLVDVLFYMLLLLLDLASNKEAFRQGNQPHSPSIRLMLTSQRRLEKEYFFLKTNDIHTVHDLDGFINRQKSEIAALEQERQKIRNSNRRPKTEEERIRNNTASRELSARMKPLREDLKKAQSALKRYPEVWELIKTERAMENEARKKNRERNYER